MKDNDFLYSPDGRNVFLRLTPKYKFQKNRYKPGNVLRPLIAQLMHDRVHKHNKNVLAIFVGETGSGKSYMALRLAEILDPDFDINRVCFDTENFLTILKNGIETGTLKKGSVVLYDEIGISHSNRNFYESVNKALNFVFQGFRRENLITFMTVPKIKFVDLQTRELMHYLITPKKIDKKLSICYGTAYVVEQNPLLFGDEMTVRKMLIDGPDGEGIFSVTQFGLTLPSEKLRLEYEEKKKEFMWDLYNRALNLSRIAKRTATEYINNKLTAQNQIKT